MMMMNDGAKILLAIIIISLGEQRLNVSAFLNVQTRGYLARYHHQRTVLQYSSLTGEEINARLQSQLAKLREKDRTSRSLSKEEIQVIYDDEHIIVVDKPSGVLCVPSEEGISSLAQAVYENFGQESFSMDKMVVHRLGMDTSGLVVFARTYDALRGMNSLFRTRQVVREYEALVCGHVEQDEGMISMPLMRDYEFPPFMRVSTLEHQRVLLGLDATVVGKKLLEAPKACLTKFSVISRDELKEGLPVTRLKLSSISGRTHQLNVHCAAFGHAIVGDSVYGWNGDAAPNGGLDEETLSKTAPDRASVELQKEIAQAAADMNMCIHAKSISFRHPVTKEQVSFSSKAPF